jgi:drug/metabolite transporter (DMT)-like permease
VLFDRLFFAVRGRRLQTVGVLCSTLGVLAIVFEGSRGQAMTLHFGLGDVLVLASVVVWALYTVLLRLRPGIAPLSFVCRDLLHRCRGDGAAGAGEWLSGETIRWGRARWGAFAYVCVLPSIVSYFIFNSATRTVGPARAGQAITLMPLFGALLSAALLGETLHPTTSPAWR